MGLYAISYRFKGSKKYQSTIFPADDETGFHAGVDKWLEKNKKDAFDKDEEVDRRTIKWAGDTIPLTHGDEPVNLHVDLNDYV